MITNEVQVEERIREGSFKLSLKFELFEIHQNIVKATFDTGCSHSLISAKSLNLGSRAVDEVEHEALMDFDVILSVGMGIESTKEDVIEIAKEVNRINRLKKKLKQQGMSKEEARQILEENISVENEVKLKHSKNVRYLFEVHGCKIQDIDIGDIEVKISFHTNGKNLIGMHMIRRLYTKIRGTSNEICLSIASGQI